MGFLIDGNNLMYALAEAGIDLGRSGLSALLGKTLARRGRKAVVTVVFDGPPPTDSKAMQIADTGVEAHYSAGRSADDIITELIAADTAPRRLTVVSTDRQIRKAARRRRCKIVTSEDFCRMLTKADGPDQPPPPAEPLEKRTGLTAEQTRAWLREFGLD